MDARGRLHRNRQPETDRIVRPPQKRAACTELKTFTELRGCRPPPCTSARSLHPSRFILFTAAPSGLSTFQVSAFRGLPYRQQSPVLPVHLDHHGIRETRAFRVIA